MKAKAAVFMGPEKDFEVREFEVTATPKGYGRSDLIASGICVQMSICTEVSWPWQPPLSSVMNL